MRRPVLPHPRALLAVTALVSAAAGGQAMELSPNGSRPAVAGPPANFTGAVVATPLFAANPHVNTGGAQVEFSPGARSHWHTHPAGQTLIVTSGTGWVQEEGGPKVTIRPGDVVTTAPGVKHWHGATATTTMSHIAITPLKDGRNVAWMAPVTDAEYRAGEPAR